MYDPHGVLSPPLSLLVYRWFVLPGVTQKLIVWPKLAKCGTNIGVLL